MREFMGIVPDIAEKHEVNNSCDMSSNELPFGVIKKCATLLPYDTNLHFGEPFQ